jgi:diphthine synthase
MSSTVAIQQLLLLLESATGDASELRPDATLAIAASQVGSPEQLFTSGTLIELSKSDRGAPLHSLVIVGKRLHPLERDYAGRWAVSPDTWAAVARDVYGCA